MTTTLRCLLTPSRGSASKTGLFVDGYNKGNDGIDLTVPAKEVLTPKMKTSMAVRRLEASTRDTPSIFANVRKNGRKTTQKYQNDAKFVVSFDLNVGETNKKNALEGTLPLPPPSNAEKVSSFDEFFVGDLNRNSTSIVDFMFGKDSHIEHIEVADDDNSFMLGQTFDSAFNFLVVGAAASKSFTGNTIVEDHIFGKDIDQEQIEVTDDENFYGEGRTYDNGSIAEATATAAAPGALSDYFSGDDLTEVDTTVIAEYYDEFGQSKAIDNDIIMGRES